MVDKASPGRVSFKQLQLPLPSMADRLLHAEATLLVDLDGVVADQLPRLCTYLEEEYDHCVPPTAIDQWTYEIPGVDGHIGTVISELMTDRPEWYFGGMDPTPGVQDALAALQSEYRVEIATHRLPGTHHVSKQWLEDHNIPYDEFHDEVPSNKGEVRGDALIDDYHGNVADAIAAEMTGILMQQPYSDPTACTDAYLVESWDDVTGLLL